MNFVGLEGEEKDKLVVIGEGVDAVKLIKWLRKKVGQTNILRLTEVKDGWKIEKKHIFFVSFIFVVSTHLFVWVWNSHYVTKLCRFYIRLWNNKF